MDLFRVFIKGLWIGGTLTIPGVSGGSMAMILGVYEQLIRSLNGLFKRGTKKIECFRFLLMFSLGGLLGIILIAKVVLNLMARQPAMVTYIFAGAIFGGTRIIFREINSKTLTYTDLLYPIIGIGVVLCISSMPKDLFHLEGTSVIRWLIQLIGGILAGAALILPGISISQVLYIFGMYASIFGNLSTMNFLPLIPFAIGLMIGIILVAKILEDLLDRFRKEAYLAILGFIIASVIQLFKAIPSVSINLGYIVLFLFGFAFVFLISKKRAQ